MPPARPFDFPPGFAFIIAAMAAKIYAVVLALALALPCRGEELTFAPPRTEEASVPGSPAADVTLYALSLTGTPYHYGGRDTERGFDCSGFVGHVFREVAGIDLPRSAEAIARLGREIGLKELKPGDLVFFNTLRRAFSHVGIYLGNQQFIHASSSKTGEVMISSLREAYWARRFDGARRLPAAAP